MSSVTLFWMQARVWTMYQMFINNLDTSNTCQFPSQNFLFSVRFFFLWFMCVCVCVNICLVQGVRRGPKRTGIPWGRPQAVVSFPSRALGTEPGSCGRTGSALTGAMSPVPNFICIQGTFTHTWKTIILLMYSVCVACNQLVNIDSKDKLVPIVLSFNPVCTRKQ